MSILPTPVNVVKNALTLQWRDTLIGAMALLLVACMSWIGGELMSSRDKLKSIPDPAQLVTNSAVEQRFKDEDRKIDANITTTQDSLRRIECKVDTMLLSLATRRSALASSQVPPTSSTGIPMTRIVLSDGMTFAEKSSKFTCRGNVNRACSK